MILDDNRAEMGDIRELIAEEEQLVIFWLFFLGEDFGSGEYEVGGLESGDLWEECTYVGICRLLGIRRRLRNIDNILGQCTAAEPYQQNPNKPNSCNTRTKTPNWPKTNSQCTKTNSSKTAWAGNCTNRAKNSTQESTGTARCGDS